MANVPGIFYTAETQRRGTTPVSPPNATDDPQGPIGGATVPPVAKRYASQAIMIADQNNQLEGYLYFDGTDTWWYLGTDNGDITDYEEFEFDHLPTTGTVIKFDRPRTYGDNLTPLTDEVLTDDDTRFRRVLRQVIFHQAASFTPPSTWVKSTRSDDYDPDRLNIIYVESFSDTYKRYKIEHDNPPPFVFPEWVLSPSAEPLYVSGVDLAMAVSVNSPETTSAFDDFVFEISFAPAQPTTDFPSVSTYIPSVDSQGPYHLGGVTYELIPPVGMTYFSDYWESELSYSLDSGVNVYTPMRGRLRHVPSGQLEEWNYVIVEIIYS